MKVDPSELRYGLVVQGTIDDGFGVGKRPGRIVMLVTPIGGTPSRYENWKGIEIKSDGMTILNDDGTTTCSFLPSHDWSHPR